MLGQYIVVNAKELRPTLLLDKLREVLDEIQIERKKLDSTEASLLAIVKEITSQNGPVSVPPSEQERSSPDDGEKSYIENVADILRCEGRPLHISAILPRLCELRGIDIKRSSIEPSMIRHIAKAKSPKISKVGRSTYGLIEWKQQSLQPTLVQIA